MNNFFEKIGDFVDQHPEVFLVLAAMTFWHGMQYLKDYKEAVRNVIVEAENCIHG